VSLALLLQYLAGKKKFDPAAKAKALAAVTAEDVKTTAAALLASSDAAIAAVGDTTYMPSYSKLVKK
jgi:hypothetical protein